jgi:putative DNA primase/helicase
MIAAEIAATLGAGRRGGGGWWSCRCPAHDDRSPSLSLRDGDRGLIVHCHAGCDPRDVLAELQHRGLLGSHKERPEPAAVRGDDRDDVARRIAEARRMWDAALDARATPVPAYFACRGIDNELPASLRWVPSLRRPKVFGGGNGPAMVALVEHVEHGICGIHRTWIERGPAGNWCRRDRAALGPIGGGAVRLAAAQSDNWLVVAEGIETTLSVMQACGLPGWAALSADGIESLVLPPQARKVLIAADHDNHGRGERAARTAAQRWLHEGRKVRIALPPTPGADFNDVLLGRAYARIDEVRDVAA